MGCIYEKLGVIAVVLTMLSLGTSSHPFILVTCYAIHEIGHITVARILGAPMKGLRLRNFRLSLSYDNSCVTYKKEIFIQLGGIAFNLLSAALVYLIPAFATESSDFFVVCNISFMLISLF